MVERSAYEEKEMTCIFSFSSYALHDDFLGDGYMSKSQYYFRNTSIIAFFSVNKNSGVSINELEGEIDCVLVVSYPV